MLGLTDVVVAVVVMARGLGMEGRRRLTMTMVVVEREMMGERCCCDAGRGQRHGPWRRAGEEQERRTRRRRR